MHEITLYSLIHGPEVWLGIVGACGVAALGIIGVCIVNSGRLREREEEMRRKDRKNEHEIDL